MPACSSSPYWLLTLLTNNFPGPSADHRANNYPRNSSFRRTLHELPFVAPLRSNQTRFQDCPASSNLSTCTGSLGSLFSDCFSDPPTPSFPSSSHIYIGTDFCHNFHSTHSGSAFLSGPCLINLHQPSSSKSGLRSLLLRPHSIITLSSWFWSSPPTTVTKVTIRTKF